MKFATGPHGCVEGGELVVPGGMMVRKYFLENLRVPRRPVPVSRKMTPDCSRSCGILWYTTSDSYCAATPATSRCLASGMPSRS